MIEEGRSNVITKFHEATARFDIYDNAREMIGQRRRDTITIHYR